MSRSAPSRHGCSSMRDRNLLSRSWDWATWPGAKSKTGVSGLAWPKNGRPVNVENHSQLALPGRSIYSWVLGLDHVGRGFVATQRARKKTKAKEKRYDDEACCRESSYRARPCGGRCC